MGNVIVLIPIYIHTGNYAPLSGSRSGLVGGGGASWSEFSFSGHDGFHSLRVLEKTVRSKYSKFPNHEK